MMRPQFLLSNYVVCGMPSGIAIGAILIAARRLAFGVGHLGRGILSSSLEEELTAAFVVGLIAGSFFAIPMSLVVIIWPRAKHPIFAASLYASMSGSVVLTILAVKYVPTINAKELPDMLIVIGSVMILGAIYGFLLAYLANLLEKLVPSDDAV